MKGFCASTDRPRHGHLPPFLAALRRRAGLSQAEVGARVKRTYQPVHRAETAPGGVSLDVCLAIAAACGATPAELVRVRVLDALDRGSLSLPADVGEEAVTAALALLGAA